MAAAQRTADERAAAMQIWPTRSGDPLSDRINTMPKYAVSNTLENPDWANTTVVSGDVADAIKKLKEQDGQGIVQYGFGSVSKLLMERGLLDELRLWLYPRADRRRRIRSLNRRASRRATP